MPSPVACKSCGTVNPEDAFFCTHCGTQLGPVRNCPRCDSALASGAKFCHRCGFQLGVPRSERKTLIMREPTTRPEATLDDLLVTCTVMQIGLIVEHASNGGADAAAVTQEAAAWVESRLTRTGAIVARTGPNLLLAVYRSAATDKDVPMYSVRTALALQNDAEIHNDQQQERLGARFSLKLGLNTGALPVPPDRQLDHEVIRLAGRAQASCTPGAVFIAYPTFDRVRGLFWYRNAEPIAMEGQLAPIPIYEILGERESVTHVDSMGIEGVDTPMVGRQAELQTLREAYQRVARERRPEIVSVIGDTGIGKSRLNFEFLKYLESLTEIISYDFGGCPPDTPAAPYRVWRELLTRRARIFLNDSAGVAREKLIEMVASEYRDDVPPLLEASRDMYSPLRSPSDDEIERIAAGAGHLLELRFKQGAPEGTPPELEIRETYHAIQTYFELKAERRPAVIVLEDMQWADPASIDLLQTLFGNLPDLPILVVTLMSGEFLEAYPEWGDSFVNHTMLKLRPLSASEMQLLCQQILKKVDGLPSSVCEHLVRLADGNPLHLEEAIKLLLRKGLIAQSLLDDRWHLNPVEIESFEFPESIEGIVDAQLECLSERPLTVGERGAVVGLSFWQTWLTEMGREKTSDDGGDTPSKNDEDIQPQLTTLVRNGFITAKLFSQMDGDREFEFRHPIFREIFLKRLSKQTRKRYHQFVHHWYDSRRQDRRTEYLDRLAAHAEGGFSFKKAFEHWRELAIAAIHLCAYNCAELYVKKAMNLLSSNRLKLAGGLKLEYKFQLYETLAELYRLQGLDQEWRSTIETLRRIAEQSENRELDKRVEDLASE